MPAAVATDTEPTQETSLRRRRRTGLTDPGHRYEYLETDDPHYLASDRGAGPLGFTGTIPKAGTQATGLATLAVDGFGGGPRVPLVPETWEGES
ncbi:putative PPE family protein PPE2 [Mycobacterium talmoniae]|uniref:Putative PPE family protein PPE2 n=1 Tax=Mycobacterium talmoniae TaxID=1858794 RepID=A0A2S8BHW2_9MYCO|nr:putative PPE family protein PPE2 [Mycobacterium talmoniae]